MRDQRFAQIMGRLVRWAERDANIRALIVTGSSPRGAGSAARFSDRDELWVVKTRDWTMKQMLLRMIG